MTGVSVGTELISGLPIDDMISQLLAIESRPLHALQSRVAVLQSQRTALMEISARVLGIHSAVASFDNEDFFRAMKAGSSDNNALLATAGLNATVGSYQFRVHCLASTHQLLAGGWYDLDQTPLDPGTLTIESAQGGLRRATPLAVLNEQAGVRRGIIRITDCSGSTATADLTTAMTVDDVLEAINALGLVQVQAAVQGDRIVLTDETGLTGGQLVVQDVGGGHAAADLGIAGQSSTGVIQGADLVRLGEATPLQMLNDGMGLSVRQAINDLQFSLHDGSTLEVDLSGRLSSETRLAVLNRGAGVAAGAIRITDRSGASAEIDLSAADCLGEVVAAIKDSGLAVNVVIGEHGLILSDTSGQTEGTLAVEEVDGGTMASDLGLLGNSASGSITGRSVYSVTTLGDVLRAINLAPDNDGRVSLTLASEANGLLVTDLTTGQNQTTVESLNGCRAAEDLGLAGLADTAPLQSRDLLAGLNTVLLGNLLGGQYQWTGQRVIQLQAGDGTVTQIDLTRAQTVQQVLDTINAQSETSKVWATVNAAGNGLLLIDQSSVGGTLVVSDVVGTFAEDLGLAGSGEDGQIDSGNLQLRYVSGATRLSDFNNGQGVAAGRFRITDAAGNTDLIDLSQGSEVTLQDVIEEINSRPNIRVNALVNDSGDGLLLIDESGGQGRLKVQEDRGTTAADLGILGQADEGENWIDGSLELQITIDPGDTLQAVADNINQAGRLARAGIVKDGSAGRPYRLTLTSLASGVRGQLMVDGEDSGLDFATLLEGRDAMIFVGSGEGDNPLLLASSSNTFEEVIPDVRLELLGTSSEPVGVTITRDLDGVVAALKSLADAFNDAIGRLKYHQSYNAATQERGLLLADPTAMRVEDRLYAIVREKFGASGSPLRGLAEIGLSLENEGQLTFDEQKFREVYARDSSAVEDLFAAPQTGLGDRLQELIDQLTDSINGLLPRANKAMQAQEDFLKERIESMQELLDAKEARLRARFAAMEAALAALQEQQSALGALPLTLT